MTEKDVFNRIKPASEDHFFREGYRPRADASSSMSWDARVVCFTASRVLYSSVQSIVDCKVVRLQFTSKTGIVWMTGS